MKKSQLALVLIALASTLAIAAVAQARYIANYDLIVPKIGGSAYTSTLTKVNTSRGVDNNTSHGGGYTMSTAIYRPTTTRVTPKFDIASGSRVVITYNAGQNVATTGFRLGHTNKLTTLVNVQSRGSWSPDEY